MKVGVNLLNFGPGALPENFSEFLLDFFTGDVEATRSPETYFRVMKTLAERVLDLPRQTLR